MIGETPRVGGKRDRTRYLNSPRKDSGGIYPSWGIRFCEVTEH